MGRLFGTDGARGIAITELTCELAMQIGRAAALELTKTTNHRPKIYIGKDTRISSSILECALISGICSVGADAVQLGVVPTPAVAYLIRKNHADAGVMISASHNSVEYNGIKLFAGNGYKLPDEVENEIERLILDNPEEIKLVSHTDVGRVSYYPTAKEDYIDYVCSTIKEDLSGIDVALDCANGSSSVTAGRLFTKLGANVHVINDNFDGTNINDSCGSTHMEGLIEYVKANRCDIGLAFDGDADRCLAVDENGNLIDGDKIIAICSKSYKDRGLLKGNTAVVTVMTNIGFSIFAKENSINFETTKVGDRYVLENMREHGYSIGGEQSGHIIFLDDATTGDGELSGAKLLEIIKLTGKKASELASCMESYPQVLVNVSITLDKKGLWDKNATIMECIHKHENTLNGAGRVLVRESGTEPLIRVMLEGKDLQQITAMANDIAETIKVSL